MRDVCQGAVAIAGAVVVAQYAAVFTDIYSITCAGYCCCITNHITVCIWVIPCQLIHFSADPSPILMKFGKLGGQQKKQIHTKFQLIPTIFNGVRAL